MRSSYRVSMATWGTSVVTVVADSEAEAVDLGEKVFRAAFQQQSTFPQFLSGDWVVGDDVISNYEVEHSIDTEFEVEANALYEEDDPRVEAMARAYMQEIYATDDMTTEDADRARDVARIMLREVDHA